MSPPKPKPLLLRFATAIGSLAGTLGVLIGVWALLSLATHDGPYRINEIPVARAEFIAAVLPMLVLFTAACVTGGAAAWALWHDKVGSRPLLALLLAELVLGDVYVIVLGSRWLGTEGLQRGSILSILLVGLLAGLAYWYLFRKSAVVEYYESLRIP